MLTWKFWLALRKAPVANPLFQHTLASHYDSPRRPNSILFLWLLTLSSLGFCYSVVFNWLPLALLLAILLANTFYSLLWTLKVSGLIAQEKEQKRYDLVSVLPAGAVGASWSITVGALHRNSMLAWLHFLIRMLTAIFFVTLVGALLITIVVTEAGKNRPGAAFDPNADLIYLVIAAFALVTSFYIDHIQSVVLASLFGIYAAMHGSTRGEIRLVALGGFLFLQFLVYALTGLICLMFIPNFYVSTGTRSVPMAILLSALSVVIFFSVREILFHLLWRLLRERLNTDALEFKEVTMQPSV